MTRSMSMVEARNRLTQLPEDFEETGDLEAIAITRRGKPVLAVMPWELYDGLLETLEIMSDDQLMDALRQSINEAASGQVVAWDDVRQELDV